MAPAPHTHHSHDCCETTEDALSHCHFQSHSCWACQLHPKFAADPDIASLQCVRQTLHAVLGSGIVALGVFCLVMSCVISPLIDGPAVAEATGGSGGGGSRLPIMRLLVSAVAVLGAVLAYNVRSLKDHQVLGKVPLLYPSAGANAEDDAEAGRHLGSLLSEAVQIETVSYDYDGPDGTTADLSTFDALHALLRARFPLVHTHLSLTTVNGHSMLFEWTGTDASLPAAMLCAHLDVVPALDPAGWEHPPFSGHLDEDGVVWGRGAIDNKHNVITQLAAVEALLEAGVERPRRTLLLAMGHDEEVGGSRGAAHIAEMLRGRGVRCEYILDEGPMILTGGIPGREDMPVAFVGNAEKGAVNVKLVVDSACEAGHSSSPPLGETNVGVLSKAVARLEAEPFPAHMGSYINTMTFLGSQLPLALRVVVANTWLFSRVLQVRVCSYVCVCGRTTWGPVKWCSCGLQRSLQLWSWGRCSNNYRTYPFSCPGPYTKHKLCQSSVHDGT